MTSIEDPRRCAPLRRCAWAAALGLMLIGCQDDAGDDGTTGTGTGSVDSDPESTGMVDDGQNDDADDGADSTGGGPELPDPPTDPACDPSADGEPIPAGPGVGGTYALYTENGEVPVFAHPLHRSSPRRTRRSVPTWS